MVVRQGVEPGTSGRRAPTLETVAAVSGFSRATVSRVINGSTTVAPEIRRAVEEVIDQIGYVPNRAARSLVTRRTGSIALVVREPVEFGLADSYLSSMVVAASQSLAGTGVQLAVMMAANDSDHAKLGAYVRGGHVDGVLLISVHDDDPLPGQLIRAGVPVVIGGRPATPLRGGSSVDSDNRQGGGLAAEHLIGIGRTRLAVLAGPSDMTAAVDRLDGFRAAVRAAGLEPPAVAYGDFTRESGAVAMREILHRRPDTDAVFGGNDLMAMGALKVLREAGRQVPADVAVLGFDDINLSRYCDPPLSTVHQPIAEQARLMVQMVLDRIEGKPVEESVVLPVRLVHRASTGGDES
jgi:DNA-binding LacI/PurR family transcriptional regulator